jgi:hypothetical protein
MTTSNTAWLAGAALAIGLAAQARAQLPVDTDNSFLGQPVAAIDLADQRGGASITHSEMTLAGTTADNTAINVTTGTNTITAGAFANMSGLPLVVQNSGANVLIQNAVIVNLQMQ